jgi:hypothetical protein
MVSLDRESVSLTAFPVLLPQFSIKAAVRIKNRIFFIFIIVIFVVCYAKVKIIAYIAIDSSITFKRV